MELRDSMDRLIVVPDAMKEAVIFIQDCEKEQKIHPNLADEIIALIAKNANLLVKEMTK